MTSIKTDKIKKGLKKKGFREDEEHDHIILRLYDKADKPTKIFTKISHGKSEYGDPLISLVARELNLKKNELLEFINCHISQDDYYRILKEKKIL